MGVFLLRAGRAVAIRPPRGNPASPGLDPARRAPQDGGVEMSVLLPLLLKMGISALIVVLASLAVERTGPVIGALIATLPVAGGPAYVFLAMEHGPEFIAAGTLASFPAMIGQAAYQVVYVLLAQRHRMPLSLGCALATWVAVAFAVRQAEWGFAVLAPLSFAGFGGAYLILRPYMAWRGGVRPGRRWFDVPMRAGAVMMVTATTLMAGRLAGPSLAGLAATMPTVFTSLILILQPRIGGPNTAAVVASGVAGMGGFTAGLCFLHLTAVPLGSVAALSGTLGVCVAWNIGLLFLQRRRA